MRNLLGLFLILWTFYPTAPAQGIRRPTNMKAEAKPAVVKKHAHSLPVRVLRGILWPVGKLVLEIVKE